MSPFPFRLCYSFLSCVLTVSYIIRVTTVCLQAPNTCEGSKTKTKQRPFDVSFYFILLLYPGMTARPCVFFVHPHFFLLFFNATQLRRVQHHANATSIAGAAPVRTSHLCFPFFFLTRHRIFFFLTRHGKVTRLRRVGATKAALTERQLLVWRRHFAAAARKHRAYLYPMLPNTDL